MKIALVAMSGVRAHNPELTALGLSLPGFVERGKTIASLPSLGLLTLAALTDDRHDIAYYEVDDIAEMDPLPECDLVAFSTYTAQVKECYAPCRSIPYRGYHDSDRWPSRHGRSGRGTRTLRHRCCR